jgi:Uma2 family endonuclease
MAAIPLKHEIYYPESDGEPMGETDVHVTEIAELLLELRAWFRQKADVYVGADMLLYYVEGDPRRCVCPDVFVTVGVPNTPPRRSYFLWKEGRPPSMVIEVTSEGSRREDVEKKALYARLAVEEYFLFDPLDEYLSPSFQGFRLARGEYRPIRPEADGSLASHTMGLRLRREGEQLRLIDPATGQPLPRMMEREQALERAAAELEAERAARRSDQEELARLRRELERRG